MKEIATFANSATPTGPLELDSVGSTIDMIFADAVVVNEPTTVLEEQGIIRVKKVPKEVDKVSFPIIRNTQFTWNEIKRTGENVGSDISQATLNAIDYKEATPTTKSMNLFLPDILSLVNKADFDTLVEVSARDAKRQKESDTLKTIATGSTSGNSIFAIANGYTLAAGVGGTGSVGTGSTLTPTDLLKARRDLSSGSFSTGSNTFNPDFVLVHPIQYMQLNNHSDFSAADTNNSNFRRARFSADGDLVRFAGMDIVEADLQTAQASNNDQWGAAGHLALVGVKGLCVGRGEHAGMSVSTEDSRRRHGQYKVFDMSYGNVLLVPESYVYIGCSDA